MSCFRNSDRLRTVALPFVAAALLSSSACAQTPPSYEVYAIGYARVADPIPLSNVAVGADSAEMLDLHFMFWLLEGSDGRNILVDVGYLEDSPSAMNYSLPVVDYVRPDSALSRAGVDAGEISDVIITHLHWDHVDAIDLFPEARVWVQQQEYEYYTGEAWQPGGNPAGVDARDVLKLVQLNTHGRLTLVDGDAQEIFEGVTVYTGARHGYASQYVAIATGTDTVVLASDNLVAYGSMGRRVPDFLTFDAAADLRAHQRMQTIASSTELIIPGHDGAVFERFPNPTEWVARIWPLPR